MTSKRNAAISKLIRNIQKRDGSQVAFDVEKITLAIHKSMIASNEGSIEEAAMIANKVVADVVRISKKI